MVAATHHSLGVPAPVHRGLHAAERIAVAVLLAVLAPIAFALAILAGLAVALGLAALL